MARKPIESHPEVEALLRAAAPRAAQPLPRRERIVETAVAVALLGAVAALWLIARDPLAGLGVRAAVLVAAYAVAQRVRFSVGAGMTSPTQLVLVPMLLLLPPASVPLLVAAALLLSRLPEYVNRKVHPDHAVLHLGDAWFAVGPAAVLALAPHGAPSFALWPLYLAAFAAQLVLDAGSSLLRERLALGVPATLQLQVHALVVSIDLALAPIGLLVAGATAPAPFEVLAALPLLAMFAVMGRERERRIHHAIELSDAYRGTALLMGEMLEADDEYTGGEHSHGVVALALGVGRTMGMDAHDQRNLEFASLLHDIGKLRVPNEIINKPGKLTDAEWEIIKRHPADGQEMLDRIGGVLAEVGVSVRGHHERWDGGGYPDGLVGDAIPLAARIICACDAYSAMTTNRSYRAAMPPEEALAELRRCAGSQFDPAVVDAIERTLAEAVPEQPSELLAA